MRIDDEAEKLPVDVASRDGEYKMREPVRDVLLRKSSIISTRKRGKQTRERLVESENRRTWRHSTVFTVPSFAAAELWMPTQHVVIPALPVSSVFPDFTT
jgi:hypothetical protein